MLAEPWVVAGLTFVLGLVCLMSLAMITSRRGRPVVNRLAREAGDEAAPSRLNRDAIEFGGATGRLMRWGMQHLRRRDEARPANRRVQNTLYHAGLGGLDKLVIFHVTRVASVLVFGLAGFIFGYSRGAVGMLIALLAAVIGYFLPEYALNRIARERQRLISRDLPTVLDLLIVCLEAGVGLNGSIKIVSREGRHGRRALGKELGAVAAELDAGVPLDNSLRDLAERTGVDEIKSIVALVIQSEKLGSRLAPSLRASVDLLTSHRQILAEERAQRSTIKMLVPLVMLVLPAMMIVILGPAVIQILEMIG